jgi:hypothetical protein
MDRLVEIQDLIQRFADAVNRQDAQQFESLWTPEATWRIDPPTDLLMEGTRSEIAQGFAAGMEANWEWFVQLPHGVSLAENRDDALIARSYVVEKAKARTGESYSNIGYYVDEIVQSSGEWLFRSRHYQYIYLDPSDLTGEGFSIKST